MADQAQEEVQQIALPSGSAEQPLFAIGFLELVSSEIQDRYDMDPTIMVRGIDLDLAAGIATLKFYKKTTHTE